MYYDDNSFYGIPPRNYLPNNTVLNQAQFATQTPMLSGRMISFPEEIRPNEVPMDGSPSYFPCRDGNAIFSKRWNPDGTISTVKYVVATEASTSDPLDELTKRVTKLEEFIKNELGGANE